MFIASDLETLLSYLNQLTADAQPLWGSMSAQRMVEHLTDTLRIANGKSPQTLAIPEDRIESMLRFLDNDKPMMRDIKVPFATPEMNAVLRNEELELAVDEFVEEWLEFEELFDQDPERKVLHPFYGELNRDQWMRLASKHHTHHFTQFGLL